MLGDQARHVRQDDADEHGPEDLQVADVELRDEKRPDEGEHCTGPESTVDRSHRRLVAIARTHDQDAEGGREDPDAGNDERVEQAARRRQVERLERGVAEDQRGDDRDLVGLEEVGRHSGTVADVVADVVCDRGGVTRVVLGNSRLDLADEVGPHVGGFGEDATTDTHEQGDQRCTEPEAHQHGRGAVLEDEHDRRGTDETQTYAEQAGDPASAEGHLERRR